MEAGYFCNYLCGEPKNGDESLAKPIKFQRLNQTLLTKYGKIFAFGLRRSEVCMKKTKANTSPYRPSKRG